MDPVKVGKDLPEVCLKWLMMESCQCWSQSGPSWTTTITTGWQETFILVSFSVDYIQTGYNGTWKLADLLQSFAPTAHNGATEVLARYCKTFWGWTFTSCYLVDICEIWSWKYCILHVLTSELATVQKAVQKKSNQLGDHKLSWWHSDVSAVLLFLCTSGIFRCIWKRFLSFTTLLSCQRDCE